MHLGLLIFNNRKTLFSPKNALETYLCTTFTLNCMVGSDGPTLAVYVRKIAWSVKG